MAQSQVGNKNGRPNIIDVSVTMDSPSFVPGSRVSAIITIRSEHKQDNESGNISKHLSTTSPKLISTGLSPPGSATLRGLGTDEYTLIDYVVCEVSGRWITDRTLITPNAHNPVSSNSLDLHAQPPLPALKSSNSGNWSNFRETAQSSTRERRTWDAALDDANKIGGGGRLGYSGVIFRSQTLVVCEREQIPVGSQTSFSITCVLPDEIPPTLRGAAVRYSYNLIVVIGLPGFSTPKSIRVPFRVVLATSIPSNIDSSPPIVVPTPKSSGPVCNLFLEHVKIHALSMSANLLKSNPPDDIEVALALSLNGRLTPYAADDDVSRNSNSFDDDPLSFVRATPPTISRTASELADVVDEFDNLASPNTMRARQSSLKRNAVPVYSITRGNDSLARMYLTKRRLMLGDNITAVFYFNSENPCLQLGARLEMHEIIKPKHSLSTQQGNDSPSKGTIFRKVYGEHGEFVMMNRNTHVTFSIPFDAPATFATDVVEIRWLIHFVFLIPQRDRKIRASPHLAESTVLDDHEATRLLGDLEIQPDSSDDDELPGWSGGVWAGEDPATFKAIPRGKTGDVEVLRWSLPLRVSGSPNSQWGTRSSRSLRFETCCK